ncbi:SEC10/PgrA surface exclusion domain-containing protein [Streptococcus hyovaginalis]|uniref:SEC10/PgrA surface exclusion domain-containing protein n=1 Tax=Streptococcus hyovaginalis TaxID=149015 RepID=UPI003B3BE1D0
MSKSTMLASSAAATILLAGTGMTSTVNADEVVDQTVQPSTEVTTTTPTTAAVTDQQLDAAQQEVTTTEAAANQAENTYTQAVAKQTTQQEVVDQAAAELASTTQSVTMTPSQVEETRNAVDTANAALPQAETDVVEAQANVDTAQALADQPVTSVVDQEAVNAAQADVDTKSADVTKAQSELDAANTALDTAKTQASDAETVLSRLGSDERAMLTSDFDFEAEYGVTAMEYWNSVGGDTNVMALDRQPSTLSEDSNLVDSTAALRKELRFDSNFENHLGEINGYEFNPANQEDLDWKLDLNNLSDFELRTLSNYAANTINGLRESMQKQLTAAGSDLILPKVQVTEESITSARKHFDWLRANYPNGYDGHVVWQAASDPQLKDTLIARTQSEAVGNAFAYTASKNMLAVKSGIVDQLSKMLFTDEFAGHGHTDIILGIYHANRGFTGVQTLTFTPINFDNGMTKFIFDFTRPDSTITESNKLDVLPETELTALRNAAASVATAEKAVQDATTKLTSAQSALTSAEATLAEAKKGDVSAAQAEALRRLDALEDAKNELVAAQNKVAELKDVISTGQAQLDAHSKGTQAIADAEAKLASAEQALADAKTKTVEAKADYEIALAAFNTAKTEYARLLAIRAAEDATKPVDNTTKPVEDATGNTKPENESKTSDEGFDFSKLVGTWRNGEGRTITINSDGTYYGDDNGLVGTTGTRYNNTNIWSVGIKSDFAMAGGLLYFAPAGTAYPNVGQAKDASDISQDRFMLTNAYPEGTATNTYYRVAAESKPADNTTKPVDNTTKPVDNTTKSVGNGQKATKPNETGKLALNATKIENNNQVKTLGAGITKKANSTVSYSRIAANNTLPKTGEENNTSSILTGLALLLSGSLFLGKRKED